MQITKQLGKASALIEINRGEIALAVRSVRSSAKSVQPHGIIILEVLRCHRIGINRLDFSPGRLSGLILVK